MNDKTGGYVPPPKDGANNFITVPGEYPPKLIERPIVPENERKPGVKYNKDGKPRAVRHTKFITTSLDRMRPLFVDAEGYALPPPTVTPMQRNRFGEGKRKVYFLWMYNFSCANITMSCQYAGIVKDTYLEWLKSDPLFVTRQEEVKDEIVERAMFKYWTALGMIRNPSGTKVTLSPAALRQAIRGLRPDLFKDEEEEDVGEKSQLEVRDSIPRSPWPKGEVADA